MKDLRRGFVTMEKMTFKVNYQILLSFLDFDNVVCDGGGVTSFLPEVFQFIVTVFLYIRGFCLFNWNATAYSFGFCYVPSARLHPLRAFMGLSGNQLVWKLEGGSC